MDLLAIATQLDTTLGAVAGIVEHYPQGPDAIGDMPCLVIGQPKGTTMPGATLQVTTLQVPITVYVARIADDARSRVLLNPLANAIIAALAPINEATGAQLLWSAVESIDWDTDRSANYAGSAYLAIEFVLHMTLHETVNPSAAI